MIYDHTHPAYRHFSGDRVMTNGAYWYSVEIVRNIIPRVKTDRPWVTVNCGMCEDGAIVFIHNNLNAHLYDWLLAYKDLILVCGVPETCYKVEHLGTPIYLPLSIDVAEVEGYKRPKTKSVAYAGRRAKPALKNLPRGIDFLSGKERWKLLELMAEYEQIYAVGRTAIEAKALGCEILPFDPRFPDPDFWKVIDNKEAASLLQEGIDTID